MVLSYTSSMSSMLITSTLHGTRWSLHTDEYIVEVYTVGS